MWNFYSTLVQRITVKFDVVAMIIILFGKCFFYLHVSLSSDASFIEYSGKRYDAGNLLLLGEFLSKPIMKIVIGHDFF